MLTRLKRLTGRQEEGQALVLLCFMLLVVLGATAMSVDVGRAYWAKTQVQAAVDSAALAGAAGLPNTATAGTLADKYWNLNNGFLVAQGRNVTLTKTFSSGQREINLTGSADVDTWFARVFGIDTWHVSASASAEYQKVDAMLVLDRSGSMCYDSHGDGDTGFYNKSVRLGAAVTSTATTFTIGRIAPATGALTDFLWVGQRFQLGTVSGGNPSPSSEWMQIATISPGLTATTITVTRKVTNPNTNSASTAGSHNANDRIMGSTCTQAGKGPFLPWSYIKTGGNVFVNNMNSVYDKIGYVDFGSTATLNQDFTANWSTAGPANPGLRWTITNTKDPGVMSSSSTLALNGDGAAHYTNISHGIWYGVQRHLTSSQGRTDTAKVIVLLSDGAATTYCTNGSVATGYSTSCTAASYQAPSSNSTSTQRAKDAAIYAKSKNITIYTISYGSEADESLMQYIADTTGGKHYLAPNEAALNAAFQTIAQSTHVKMTK